MEAMVIGKENELVNRKLARLARKMRRAERALSRGVTLVEVLIVVAIMAVIAGGATLLVFPQFKKARNKTAVLGAGTIKQAAELYQNLNGTADVCPTIQDLVAAKNIDAKKTDDPWGSPYKIVCVDGEIHVTSPGNDRKENTPDDLRDDMKPSEIEKIGNM
jgi:general secretion pathway protein G